MANKIVIPKHVYEAEMARRKKAKQPHVAINYMVDPIPMGQLGDYLMDEIQGFNNAFNINIDEHGFVTGDLTPVDATNLAYKLIAWVKLGEI